MSVREEILKDCLNTRQLTDESIVKWKDIKLEFEAMRACIYCLKHKHEHHRVCEVCIYNRLIGEKEDMPCIFF